MTYPTPFADLWWRHVGADTLRHPAHRGRHAGGEWDALTELTVRTRRTLTGARLLTPRGMAPDELEHKLAATVGETRIPDTHAAVTWYVRHALLAIAERRRERHYVRHLRFARTLGYPTYYAYRYHPRAAAELAA